MEKMSFRKKRIGWLLIFLTLMLAACSTGKKKTGYAGAGPDAQADLETDVSTEALIEELIPEEPITVGFVQVGHESDWRIASTRSCQEEFSEENGYRLLFLDADNSPAAQVRAVRNFIKDKVDYIVIDPIVTTGWTAVLKEAYHAGIPVFIIDRTVDCSPRYYQAWIGSDFVQEGRCAGQWLQNYLSRRGRANEPVHIVTINGTTGASAQLGRTEGFQEYVERNKNWMLLDEQSGDFTESGGKQVMEAYLKAYGERIDVVVCQNDNEAFGAIEALKEADVSYGRDGELVIISFDATKAGLKAVLDGEIHADFECNPMAAPYVAQAIRSMEQGGVPAGKKQYMEEQCFTCEEAPMTLSVNGKTYEMVTVTEAVIEERAY